MATANGRRYGPAAALACALVAAALALAACSSGGPANGQNASLAKFYQQRLHWGACPPKVAAASGVESSMAAKLAAGVQCTQLTVPLNYAKPDGATIKLALNRLPATDKARRIGALVTNPGGPGGSGLEMGFGARTFFTPQLRARYDIIGMDPRGVGLSSQVECKLPAREPSGVVAQATAYGRACEQTSGKILPYVGTANAARDLDIARAALGGAKLDYYGISYGTLLGQYYAQMFPGHVGRMVLDSVDSPGSAANPTDQALGYQSALQVMAQTCVDRGHCPMGSSSGQIMSRFDKLLTRLQSSPYPVAGGTPVTADDFMSQLTDTLSDETSWQAFDRGVAVMFTGKPLPTPSGATHASPAARAATGESASDDQDGSMPAVYCLTVPRDQRTVAAARAAGQEARAVAPHFADTAADLWMTCAKWPVPSPASAGKPIRAPGTPTILLVNNTYDPRTPVSDARTVDSDLANSVLVTNEGAGHGFYQMGGCTHKDVDDFLLADRKPAPGTGCHDRPALATTPQVP
jgi:pimeloyl-ACP methyl ester carboxylesterase